MVLTSISPINRNGKPSFYYYKNIVKNKENLRKKELYGEARSSGDFNYSRLYKMVKQKYRLYDTNLKQLELLSEEKISKNDKENLLHCYTGETKSLKELKDKIIHTQTSFYQNKCAYCGLDTITGMDHYVPKEKFPEYAVHPFNLIPACTRCNTKKSTTFLDQHGKRIIFNPYFDQIDNTILKLEINYLKNYNSFTFKFQNNNKKYNSFLQKLDIIPRYEQAAQDKIENIIQMLITSFESYELPSNKLSDYQESVKCQLMKLKDKKKELQGLNSIEYLIYNSFYISKYSNISFLVSNFGSEEAKLKLKKLIQ